MLIADLTMNEFAEAVKTCRTVLLPFGATEEHGSHLPLSTDTIIPYQVGLRLSELRPMFVAPPIPYGVCRSTRCHPGTISITTATLRSLTCDIVTSLYDQGLRNFILLTGHAGGTHGATLVDAGEDLLCRLPEARIAVLTEHHLVLQAAADLIETRGDSHAGEIETSRLLHSHPHLVKGAGEPEFPSFPGGILVRDKRRFWPGGVWGDPTKASASKGELLEQRVVAELGRIVAQLENPAAEF